MRVRYPLALNIFMERNVNSFHRYSRGRIHTHARVPFSSSSLWMVWRHAFHEYLCLPDWLTRWLIRRKTPTDVNNMKPKEDIRKNTTLRKGTDKIVTWEEWKLNEEWNARQGLINEGKNEEEINRWIETKTGDTKAGRWRDESDWFWTIERFGWTC